MKKFVVLTSYDPGQPYHLKPVAVNPEFVWSIAEVDDPDGDTYCQIHLLHETSRKWINVSGSLSTVLMLFE